MTYLVFNFFFQLKENVDVLNNTTLVHWKYYCSCWHYWCLAKAVETPYTPFYNFSYAFFQDAQPPVLSLSSFIYISFRSFYIPTAYPTGNIALLPCHIHLSLHYFTCISFSIVPSYPARIPYTRFCVAESRIKIIAIFICCHQTFHRSHYLMLLFFHRSHDVTFFTFVKNVIS